jgi:hypothetical protein
MIDYHSSFKGFFFFILFLRSIVFFWSLIVVVVFSLFRYFLFTVIVIHIGLSIDFCEKRKIYAYAH